MSTHSLTTLPAEILVMILREHFRATVVKLATEGEKEATPRRQLFNAIGRSCKTIHAEVADKDGSSLFVHNVTLFLKPSDLNKGRAVGPLAHRTRHLNQGIWTQISRIRGSITLAGWLDDHLDQDIDGSPLFPALKVVTITHEFSLTPSFGKSPPCGHSISY